MPRQQLATMATPRVQGLNGVGLEVPDLAVARKFYETFGLQAREAGEALALRSPGRDNDEIVITRGAVKRMSHLSFRIEPGTESAFADKLKAASMNVGAGPASVPRAGLWFQDPWGTWINLSPVAAQASTAKTPSEAPRVDVHRWRELEKDPKPARIGHMLMFTPEFEKAEKFFEDVLGLRTSDRAAGKVAFMAAGDGVTDHHCFGLIPSTHRGFQHASFQVGSIDDIGFATLRMRKAGYTETFGPGRHALASNLFCYIRDPWGSWVEYYADMDRISPAWQTRDWNELPYIWGPDWAPEFWGKEMNGNFEPRG